MPQNFSAGRCLGTTGAVAFWKLEKLMNNRQLLKLGVPVDCVEEAIAAIQRVNQAGGSAAKQVETRIKAVLHRPEQFFTD